MKTKVKGLTIWVTGASSGIGEALAIELAKRGANLILSGRNKDKLLAAKTKCKRSDKHHVVCFDITDAAQTKEAYAQVKQKTDRVDWLINNAGVSQRSFIVDTDEEVERQLMEINYFGQIRLTRLVLPDMLAQGGGKIVMISSIAGLLGAQYRGGYGAAKAAIHLWANSLRAELHDQGIEVATIFPGFVQTQVSVNALIADGSPQGTMDEATAQGMTAKTFAQKAVKALRSGKEYIVVVGRTEQVALKVNRLSPPKMYKLIRNMKMT